MIDDRFWDNYREELIATSVVISLSAVATFFVAGQLTGGLTQSNPTPQATPTPESSQVLGEAINTAFQTALASPTPAVTPTPSLLPTPTPTKGPEEAEVFYGIGGTYEYEDFALIINSPRITFDVRSSSSRTFLLEAILRNKTVEAGLSNRLVATIVKDGNIIVPEAALSLSESVSVKPGEQLTFQARLSLIEGTDVQNIRYVPAESTNRVDHVLRPDY